MTSALRLPKIASAQVGAATWFVAGAEARCSPRVHSCGGYVVCRDEHRDLLLAGEAGQDRDDTLLAAQVQVGEVLIQQQPPRTADHGVRDHDPLLLTAGQLTDPGVGVAPGVDGGQGLGDQFPPGPGRERHAEPLAIQPEGYDIARPQWHVGSGTSGSMASFCGAYPICPGSPGAGMPSSRTRPDVRALSIDAGLCSHSPAG